MKIIVSAKKKIEDTPYVTANSSDQEVKKLKKDVSDADRKIKKLESEVKMLTRKIDSLNLGQRRFWEQKTIFTSLQRKIERFEKVEQEWKKYKAEMDAKIKKVVEKRHRAQI